MNNRGFTLIEVLCTLVLTSIIIITVFTILGTTFSASKEEAYKIMKSNLLAVGYDYVNECALGTISCDFSFEENNRFMAVELQNVGFFKDLESPIDGKNLGTCLILEATKNNGVTVINLIDNCYSNLENNIPVIKYNENIESGDIKLEVPNKDGNSSLNNIDISIWDKILDVILDLLKRQ